MAKKNVESLLNELASKVLIEVGSKETKDPRKLINTRPHIYTLNYVDLLREVTDQVQGKFSTIASTKVEITPYRQRIIKEACKKYFRDVRANMLRGRAGFQTEVIKDSAGVLEIKITGTNPNSSVFVTFIDNARRRSLAELRDTLYTDLLLDPDESISQRILGYEKDGKRIGGVLDIGHVEGYSIAEKRVQLLFEKLEAKLKQAKKSKASYQEPLGNLILAVKSNPRASILKNISFSSEIYVREQGVESNRRVQGKQEAMLVASIKKQITNLLAQEDWVNFKSSPSAMDDIKSSVFMQAVKAGANKKGVKTSLPQKSAYRASKKLSINKEVITLKDQGVELTPKGKRTSKQKVKPSNWLQLLPIINSKLTQNIISNMGAPRLENRTGRFARSARVTNVETTPQGFPTFVFDYQRDPYDVFDKTLGRSPWNTPERDPRTLVDQSIRDIVREMAIGRFFTRRA